MVLYTVKKETNHNKKDAKLVTCINNTVTGLLLDMIFYTTK
jgi:hypothetical protein